MSEGRSSDPSRERIRGRPVRISRSAERAVELFRHCAGRAQILVHACRGGTLFTTSVFIRG